MKKKHNDLKKLKSHEFKKDSKKYVAFPKTEFMETLELMLTNEYRRGRLHEVAKYLEMLDRNFKPALRNAVDMYNDLRQELVQSKNAVQDKNIPFTKTNPEKEKLIKLIKKHGGNKSKAADELNISRTTIYKRLKKYNIKV